MTELESQPPSAPAAAPVLTGGEVNEGRASETSEPAQPLPVERLYRSTDLSMLTFESTADIEPADGLIGQQRALEAIEFGTRIGWPGFNLFVIGPSGMRMQHPIERVLQEAAAERHKPSDWVYVNNFDDPRRPVAVELPAAAC